jgi:hypothetical protein
MRKQIWILSVLLVLVMGLTMYAQQQGSEKAKVPTLLFREDFKAMPAGQVQFTQEAVTNPNLELKVYGPGSKPGSGRDSGLLLGNEADEPSTKIMSIAYTGVVQANWGIMFRDKNNYLDLRDAGRFRWRLRQRSLHQLRPLIKLADGTLLVGDYAEPLSSYMRESEFYLVDVPRWRPLNPTTMYEDRNKPGEPLWKTNVDLSKVDEIGFTSLMAGAGHGTSGNTAVDWIEVWGQPVKRTAR